MADTSISQVQRDFQPVMEELNLRVKELRELQSQLESERTEFGEGLHETQSHINNLEERIKELSEEQRKLSDDFHAPRLTREEADKIDQDKQISAFLKYCRFAAGSGEKLTEEERAALYPDGKTYSLPSEPGQYRSYGPEQARALVENSTGQILVPESFDTAIMQTVEKESIIRPLATVRSVASDREKYRKLTQFSVAYGEALELGGSVSESNITPTEHYQYIENGYGLAWFGVNELEDSDVNLVQYMTQSFARAKRETEDTKFLRGSGHSSFEPEALIDSSTLTAITAAGAAAITFDDLQDLIYGYEDSNSTALKSSYQKNACFIMHPFTELAVMKLADDNGQYLWQPTAVAGVPNTIRGYPVHTSTDMPQIAASANSVYFGDVRSTYRILDRRGMTMQRLVEVQATAGLVGFLFSFRNTGGIVRAEASRLLAHPAA